MTPRHDDPYITIEKLETQLQRKNVEIEKLTNENKSLKRRLAEIDVDAKNKYIHDLIDENRKLKEKQALTNIFEPDKV